MHVYISRKDYIMERKFILHCPLTSQTTSPQTLSPGSWKSFQGYSIGQYISSSFIGGWPMRPKVLSHHFSNTFHNPDVFIKKHIHPGSHSGEQPCKCVQWYNMYYYIPNTYIWLPFFRARGLGLESSAKTERQPAHIMLRVHFSCAL